MGSEQESSPAPGSFWVDGWWYGLGDKHAGHLSEDHTGMNGSKISHKDPRDGWG